MGRKYAGFVNLLLIIVVVYSIKAGGVANSLTVPPGATWPQPTTVQLPPPQTLVMKESDSSDEQSAPNHQTLGDIGEVYKVSLGESGELCGQAGAHCEPNHCIKMALQGEIHIGGGEGEDSTTIVLKKPPAIDEFFADEAAGSDYCSASDNDFSTGGPMLIGSGDGFDVPNGDLPADTDCWELGSANMCQQVKTPLEALVPAIEQDKVVVILAAADAQQTAADIASEYRLEIESQSALEATSESIVVYQTGSGQNPNAVIDQLSTDGRVAAAQQEFIYRTSARYADPLAAMSYGPAKIGATRLHQHATGKDKLVAIIDSGVDIEHPELKGKIDHYQDVTEKGWSADSHGTAIAGIIAAQGNNGQGSYGVAPDVRILAIKACHPKNPGTLSARCWTSTLVKALNVAIQRDAKLINMSFGGPPDPLVERYVGLAYRQGRILVAAAGNSGRYGKPAFPAALEPVLAITALDVQNKRYGQANSGEYVDLAAPGVDIISTLPGNQYPVLSGTSMAAAHVTGVAALLLELGPGVTTETLYRTLVNTAVDLGEKGADLDFGAGLIDGCSAAEAVADRSLNCK